MLSINIVFRGKKFKKLEIWKKEKINGNKSRGKNLRADFNATVHLETQ